MAISRALGAELTKVAGGGHDGLLSYLNREARKSFRVNTLKTEIGEISARFDCEPIPWCQEGRFCEDGLGDSIEHFQGLLYIQEAASMVAAIELAPKPGETVLDLCAAPGSKTTQMAALMENEGCIIANEMVGKRAKTLRFNLNRMGAVNAAVTVNDGKGLFAPGRFDKILLDAPCSNLGQARRDPKVFDMWTPALSQRCAKLQKGLLKSAYDMLRPGGEMVYSTCTFSVAENEAIVDYAITGLGMEVLEAASKIASSPTLAGLGKVEFDDQVARSLRIHPQDNDTDGFFMARLAR